MTRDEFNALDGAAKCAVWNQLAPAQRANVRDLSGMTPQLNGLEGWRVEVTRVDGSKARFYVGRSTGWRPCHLEVATRRSLGGDPADKLYAAVTQLYQQNGGR